VKLLFLGDILGSAGRKVIVSNLATMREALDIDFVVANGENAAGGFGLTRKTSNELFDAGVDVLTGGNHTWDQREILEFIREDDRVLRPVNYPEGTPGRGVGVYETKKGEKVGVVNALGRVFMDPLDDPFHAVNMALMKMRLGLECKAIIVDIHAEATSEKMAMGHYSDGRASLVVGTHSHVPTADAQILPNGTAYQTDAGMCGDYNSVIGMDIEEPIRRFTTKIGGRFSPAKGDGTMCGVLVETDEHTGLATSVEPVRVGGRLKQTGHR
jgi:2',3'-cyclic-nucleotide 2'-phosphodiesterase